MTTARERSEVGQGLAIGVVFRGVTGFDATKLSMEFAFGRAWRSWPYASNYRYIRAEASRNDIMQIIWDSQGRRGVVRAAWADARPGYVPFLLEAWPIGEALADLAASSEIPEDGWLELADAFIGYFDEEDLVRRA